MRIENELKLNFSDVLIRPKRSTLKIEKMLIFIELINFYTRREEPGREFPSWRRTWMGLVPLPWRYPFKLQSY
jgi:hypothetical protein